MNKTSIEWTHRPETGGEGFTWNPIRARNKETGKVGTFCTHASPGCLHCYAELIGKRFGTGLDFNVPNLEKIEFFIDEKILEEPLRRKKPATIFVGDMFDLFHEHIPVVFLGRVFGMMAKCPQHTFQLLTKRAEYMQAILSRAVKYNDKYISTPLPNVWLGVSIESPDYEKRIIDLLATPAAVRFLSIEPQLAEVNAHLGEENCLHPSLDGLEDTETVWECNVCKGWLRSEQIPGKPGYYVRHVGIDQVIVGGESGQGARIYKLEWATSQRKQCERAGVAFFMKQIGSNPEWPNEYWFGLQPPKLKDSKGGDPSEWPEALRVRKFPSERLVSA